LSKSEKRTFTKRIIRWVLKLSFTVFLIFFIFSIAQIFLFKYIDPPLTVSMVWNWINHKAKSKTYQKPSFYWRRLNRISPHLRKAVLAAEDQRFLTHHGFDFIELKAAIKDIFLYQKVRGASTISMQVARTVYLMPSRTVLRKLLEAYYTLFIELIWDKKRILEIYLNTVDWGSKIMGAEAAAIKYFNTSSKNLSPRQAALLAAILPNPHKWSPTKPSKQVALRQKRILKELGKMPLL
jgi:monofunctional biosynthetic peptidoglycan transglycosylase